MKKAEYICIVCPRSCRITVEERDDGLSIQGNSCKRGAEFARNEHTHPMRMLTTTVVLTSEGLNRLPVISTAEVPRERLAECIKLLRAVHVQAPVREGDVVVHDIGGTGVDIVSARTVEC